MTDEYHNPFISDAVQAVHKATESANKNIDNALTVAVDALSQIANTLTYGKDMVDTAKGALLQIAVILKVRQKD